MTDSDTLVKLSFRSVARPRSHLACVDGPDQRLLLMNQPPEAGSERLFLVLHQKVLLQIKVVGRSSVMNGTPLWAGTPS